MTQQLNKYTFTCDQLPQSVNDDHFNFFHSIFERYIQINHSQHSTFKAIMVCHEMPRFHKCGKQEASQGENRRATIFVQ
jgi:hypothetical protein